jgi:hypothetical protein
MPVTWDAANKNAAIALSGGNLTATSSAGANTVNAAVVATQAISPTVKQYFEITLSSPAPSYYFQFGVMNLSGSLAGNVGVGTQGAALCNALISFNSGSSDFVNGVAGSVFFPLFSSGVLRVAVDRANNKIWWAIGGVTYTFGTWFDGASAASDPATNTGGRDISAVSGTIYPAISSAYTGDVATANFGATAFAYPPPTGFVGLDSANTTWNPSDKSANCTLTGSNLIATGAAAGTNWTRAVDKQITGKFYWECTYNTNAGAGTGAGAAAPWASLVSGFSITPTSLGSFGLIHTGALYVDGSSTGLGFGSIANGTVVCFAVDCAARLVWVRVGAAGNWNTVAANNPATGVGGVAISLGAGIPLYPAAVLTGSAEQITANFGDTAFSGTVPSGFTAGWPAGTTSPTNDLVTQVALEHWLATNPPAQVTQVAIEHWASLAIAPPTGNAYALSASRAGIGSAVLWQTSAGTFMVPHAAVVSEVTAAPPPPVGGGGAQARVMVLA